MEFEPTIGLEVHAQLKTDTKIFCGCSTRFGAAPNENTCPVCLALPGALPVLNAKAIELALRAAVALECMIPPFSIFARKNYFYPDLPKGYQISQYDQPLAIEGKLTIENHDIRIKRIHMEEDAGKLLHEGIEQSSDASYVDLNRAGVPLIEIVTEPDIRSSNEAYLYLKGLKAILQFCEVSDANMEKGNLRCDANISVRSKDSSRLGTRVEIKNLNSFKNVVKALEHEFERQTKILAGGGEVVQETRLFNADLNRTEPMRTKEEAQDYRYFPDPDLLPLKCDASLLDQVRHNLPELPEAKGERFKLQYQLSGADACTLAGDLALSKFFEEAARLSGEPRQSANWILQSLLAKTKEKDEIGEDMKLTPNHIAELIHLVNQKKISGTQAKEVFDEMWHSGQRPEAVVSAKGMSQISDEGAIKKIMDEVLLANQDLATRYRNGETRVLGALVGMIMKASQGKANPALVNQLLQQQLNDKN